MLECVVYGTISKKLRDSLNDIPLRKLKPGTRTKRVRSSTRLKNEEIIFRALWQCLVDQDIDSFKEILRTHLDCVNKQQLARKSKTSRRTLYRILSPEGNPTLKNISNIIHALYG